MMSPPIQKGCAVWVTEVTRDRSSMSSAPGGRLAIGLAVVLAMMLGWWVFVGRHQAVPFVVEGWATPTGDGTAIGLSFEPGGAEEGYIITGAMWWSEGGETHEGSDLPTCIGSDPTVTNHVRMGAIRVDAGNDAPSPANTVVWIECLLDNR
jgi:hypothetical protein